jgi:protein-disulfide isomerase
MTTGKRKEIRERRLKKKRQQRMTTMLIIVGGGLLLIALLALPTIINNLKPIGEITTITSIERPMVEGRAMGDPQAPVIVDVYSDFQCPMCKVFADETEMQIALNYVTSGDVYYVYRQFPFIDDNAPGNESDQAANASMCAMEQDRFWDYHDMLFANWNGENEGSFSDQRLMAFAEALGLNMDSFKKCFKENSYINEINDDLVKGRMLDVNGTPTVFVNGVAVRKGFVPSYEDMQLAIDAALVELGR